MQSVIRVWGCSSEAVHIGPAELTSFLVSGLHIWSAEPWVEGNLGQGMLQVLVVSFRKAHRKEAQAGVFTPATEKVIVG